MVHRLVSIESKRCQKIYDASVRLPEAVAEFFIFQQGPQHVARSCASQTQLKFEEVLHNNVKLVLEGQHCTQAIYCLAQRFHLAQRKRPGLGFVKPSPDEFVHS
ncbi:MAG TPA: hypothetical protein DHW63_11490 [Hyphomonadaceae bacterium]|nr:hypothetical protein [Hyphomonadaceae bacterium]